MNLKKAYETLISEADAHILSVQEKAKSLNKDIKLLEIKKEGWEKDVAKAEIAAKITLAEIKEELETKINEINPSITGSQVELDEINKQILKKELIVWKLISETSRLSQEERELTSELASLRDQITKSEQKLTKVEQEADTISKDLSEKTDNMEKQAEELKKQSLDISSKNIELEKKSREIETRGLSLEKREAEIESKEKEISEREAVIEFRWEGMVVRELELQSLIWKNNIKEIELKKEEREKKERYKNLEDRYKQVIAIQEEIDYEKAKLRKEKSDFIKKLAQNA